MDGGKKIFISDLTAGREAEGPFLVLSQSVGRTNRGGVYLNVELGDRSGRIQAKVWDGADVLGARLAEGTVVLVRGYVDSYRGSPQFVIREARPLAAEEFHWPDYLKTSARPMAEMRAELWSLVESVPDADFRRLVSAALRSPEVGEKLYYLPAAKAVHHAYLHGLLEHSLSVGKMAVLMAGHYPKLNASLLIAGAVLHDLGKVWEFSPPPKVDYTTLGRLKGHLVMGSEFLGRVAAGMPDFPVEKLELLQHLILSHHGEPEFGAPVRPLLLEALVLHHLDNIDAKIEAVDSFIEAESDSEGWSAYHRLFGSYFRRTPELTLGHEEEGEPEKPLEPGPDAEGEESVAADDDSSDAGRLF
ncbi:MAG: HD domain-containing protein [Candidatus Adiutrix sp.]|jgi:3'-5' exoribonuclease|nr:HD domain-containing protein [Candidatus Adiutrix sp.]